MAKFIITVVPVDPCYVPEPDVTGVRPTVPLIRALRDACPGMGLLDAKNAIVAMRDAPTGIKWTMTGDQFATFCAGLNEVNTRTGYAPKDFLRFAGFVRLDAPNALDLTTYTKE